MADPSQAQPPAAPAPPLWPIIVVTALFGFFGLIPTASADGRARAVGRPSKPYWLTFGGILAAALVAQVLLLAFVALPVLRGEPILRTARPANTTTTGTVEVTTEPPPRTSGGPATTSAPVPTTPPTTLPPTTEPPTRTVTTLPSGSWITVLESLPKGQHTEHEAWVTADSMSGMTSVVVVDSDRIAGLNGGYWALSITGSWSRAEANARCSADGRSVGGSCYPRQVSG